MNDSDQRAHGTHDSKHRQPATISERKLKANRENAKKSTGPRTARGKAYSRGNALKHGLFAMNSMDFDVLNEDPEQYKELLDGLREQYQPISEAEELEVERVALCWWRLKRVWRYENVVNRIASREFTRAELRRQEEWLKEKDQEGNELILLLQSAEKEVESAGEISQDLKHRMFAASSGFEAIWSSIESITQEKLKDTDTAKSLRSLSSAELSRLAALCNIKRVIGLFEWLEKCRHHSVMEIAVGQNAIPSGESLDRILRYEAALERSLSRALDRLERLQRRRMGQSLPPPLSVHLTR